jgi:hypothetical protein
MRLHSVLSVILILALFGLHCGTGGGGNPVGVTGGSSDGYGSKNFGPAESEQPGPGPDNGGSSDIYGTWIAFDYEYGYTEMLTINPDGTYELEISIGYYTFTVTGYYSFDGEELLIDGEPATYSLVGDTLILQMYGYPIVFTRVSSPA